MKIIIIRVISEDYTIDSRKTLKVFKSFIIKTLKKKYPDYLGYEIV